MTNKHTGHKVTARWQAGEWHALTEWLDDGTLSVFSPDLIELGDFHTVFDCEDCGESFHKVEAGVDYS